MPLISFQVRIISFNKPWYSPVDISNHFISVFRSSLIILASVIFLFLLGTVRFHQSDTLENANSCKWRGKGKRQAKNKTGKVSVSKGDPEFDFSPSCWVSTGSEKRTYVSSLEEMSAESGFCLLLFLTFFSLSFILLKYFSYVFINKDWIRYTQHNTIDFYVRS